MESDRTIIGPLGVPLFLIDGKGNRLEINREMIVGREAGCDFVLDEGRCSRKHASLQPSAEGILVKDLGSSNGTFLNGARIEQGIAKVGDELSFDTAKYKVVGNGIAQAPADATLLVPPVQPPASEAVKNDPVKPAKSAADAHEAQKGAWWAPKDEGPEGTMLLSPGAAAQAALVEGTQVMAALSGEEPSLVGLSGSVKGQSFKLKGDRWKIGRDGAECDIVLEDSGVSAFHAQIINEGATWKLINLMSSNGSFVNGQRVQTAYLNSGDRLQFGATEFVFNLGGLGAMPTGKAGNATDTVTVATQGTPGWVYALGGFVIVAALGAVLLLLK